MKTEYPLTERQLDCLYYLVTGKTVKQIGEAMQLSARTVEHYLEAVRAKLYCKSRSELVMKALQIPVIQERLRNIL